MSDDQLDDGRLRDAYLRAVEARVAADRADCPTAEALLHVVRREGSEDVRLATLDHALSCAECRRELELLRSIEKAGRAGAARAVDGIRWRRAATVALAASAVLAISLGPGRRPWRRSDESLVRGGAAGISLTSPATGASAVIGAPVTFTWHPVPSARRYVIELFAPDGALALRGQTADTTLTLVVPGGLAAGQYGWWVSAQTEDGARVSSDARPLLLRTP